MKKPKETKSANLPGIRNPVAKHAPKFNTGGAFKDKTKYRRKTKHPTGRD